MDKNQLTGLLLVSILVFAYFHFFAPEPLPREVHESEVVQQEPAETASTEVSAVMEENDSLKQLEQVKKYGDFAQATQGNAADVVLENEDIKITFSTQGAVVKSILLKDYLTYDKQPLYLLDENSSQMDYFIETNNGPINLSNLYFESNAADVQVIEGDSATVVFTLSLASGQTVEKIYTLGGTGFELYQRIAFNGIDLRNKGINFQWHNNIKRQEEHIELSRNVTTVNYYLSGDGFDNLSETSTSKEEVRPTLPAEWVAIKQKFFTAGIVATNAFRSVEVSTEVDPNDSNTVKTAEVRLEIPFVEGENAVAVKYFFGPNNYKILKDVAPDFSKNIKLGWGPLSWINKFLIIPIFHFLEAYITNYGIIIFILVFIIKLLLSPLSYKSYVSMAKTKVLKPELDEIKAKHGDDMQKAQTEQMQLYQKVGINPLSGCIPMLLQMPILIAMFYFFPNSIELRQEAFLWAKDLSTYDSIINLPFTIPFYGSHVSLFCLLMTASQILYTWSNSQMTTIQGPMKTMQYIMPVAFLFFLNSFPAGLTFYYFVSNLFTFGQQAVIKKFIDEDKIRAILEENKKRNANKKKSKFQLRLEEAMKASQEAQAQKQKGAKKK